MARQDLEEGYRYQHLRSSLIIYKLRTYEVQTDYT